MKALATTFILLFISLFYSASAFSQGQFWGLANTGGTMDYGAIYKMDYDGGNFEVVHDFDYTYGANPMGDLFLASDGKMYGTAFNGGSYGSCTIYRIDPETNVFEHLWDFDVITGDFPICGFVEYSGKLYSFAQDGGAVISGHGVIYRYDFTTDTYDSLVSMIEPFSGGFISSDVCLLGGKLYGTTTWGGAHSEGTLFEYDIDAATLDTLGSFLHPVAAGSKSGVVLASDGKLYGTSNQGGSYDAGTIFSYDFTSGALNSEYVFDTLGGYFPVGRLHEGSDGLLYGLTENHAGSGGGTLFAFDPASGELNELHVFEESTGWHPKGYLDQFGSILYGNTYEGGANATGVYFQYDLDFDTYTVMHNYDSTANSPVGGNFIIYGDAPIDSVSAGITEHWGEKYGVTVYPTVSSELFNIKAQSAGKLIVYTTSGQIVYQGQITEGQSDFSFAGAKGQYIWRFSNEEIDQTGRVVLE